MKTAVWFFSAILAFGAVAAYAKNDPIAMRQHMMKAQGKAFLGGLGDMVKGKKPYNQAEVDATFTKIAANAKIFPTLFPADSKAGEKTRALPKIWANKVDFDSRFKKLGKDAEAAKASVKDLATLKIAMKSVGGNCLGCHKMYRSAKD